MRVKAVLATTLAVGTLGTAGAQAAPTVTLGAGVSGGARASADKPGNATVTAKLAIDPPGGPVLPGTTAAGRLPGARTLAISFGAGLVTALGAFTPCAAAALEKVGPEACPDGARLGSAEVSFDAYVGGSALRGTSDEAALYRATGADGVVLYVHTSSPAETVLVLPGKLTTVAGTPRITLDVSRSANVQGFDVALRSVALTLDARGTGRVAAAVTPEPTVKLPDCRRLRGHRRAACVRRSRDLEFCRTSRRRAAPGKAPTGATSAPTGGVTVLRSTGCPAGGRAVVADLAFTDGTNATATTRVACA